VQLAQATLREGKAAHKLDEVIACTNAQEYDRAQK
jgi:hypothetical protein